MPRYLIIAIAVCSVLLGCAQPAPELIIDSFEGELNSKTVDFGASQGSSVDVAAEKSLKICGEQSLKISYDLKPSGYMWVARGFNLDVKGAAQWLVAPQQIRWPSYQAFSIYMHGSNRGGRLAFDIKDAGGEIWRFMIDGKFNGWQEIICPFSQFYVRGDWQPQTAEKNEVLDFPITSFQFEPRQTAAATYYFDCIKLISK